MLPSCHDLAYLENFTQALKMELKKRIWPLPTINSNAIYLKNKQNVKMVWKHESHDNIQSHIYTE
jgi:hypothetical protein